SDIKAKNEFYPHHHHDLRRCKRSYETRKGKDDIPVGENSLKTAGGEQGAVFLTENATVVVAQTSGTAKLPCVVRKLSNGVVSWIRKKDIPPTILTVGLGTHIADERFLVEHARHLQNWGLLIKHVRPDDAGVYECQVSTHPSSSIFIELKVTEAAAEIAGAPDVHVRAGSPLRLACTVRRATEPPAYVFWYHGRRMINHEPGVTVTGPQPASSGVTAGVVTSDRSGTAAPATSVLLLKEADSQHSGNYTCYPSNATPAHVNVHVLNATEEESPAAILPANGSGRKSPLLSSILLALFINLILHLDR
ncbi:unnamed protein product, partial [Acanthoscelides obtectus]